MKIGLRLTVAGAVMLVALAGCGRGFLNYGERAPWRHQAEVTCLRSGEVKLGVGVVQVSPIDGPGACGADFPLKVAALGASTSIGYADELRPPGSVGNVRSSQLPNWPVRDAGTYAPPPRVAPVETEPIQQGSLRWVPGPQPVSTGRGGAPVGEPISLSPPGIAPPQRRDDIPDDAILPGNRARPSYAPARPAYNAPVYQPPARETPRALPPLGPSRNPNGPAAMAAAVTPPATLACPMVSALERWVSAGVQPAALHWFGSPVVEVKQISAYSCRGMVGAGTSHISEHAFGNALDIAGFVLADGRRIIVKDGWRGSAEEQGFLHDVQLYACETFNTVLAPGYNAAHYNHIHVDLMRRANGRRPCRPQAVRGEVVAARVRAVYASRQRGPAYTGSIKKPVSIGELIRGLPDALPGEDGYVADEDDQGVTGSIPEPATEEKKVVKERGFFSGWFGTSKAVRQDAVQDRMSKGY